MPAVDLCDHLLNALCAVQNVRRIERLGLVDSLNTAYYEQHEEVHNKICYGQYYAVKDFYLYMYQLSNQG